MFLAKRFVFLGEEGMALQGGAAHLRKNGKDTHTKTHAHQTHRHKKGYISKVVQHTLKLEEWILHICVFFIWKHCFALTFKKACRSDG